MKKTLIMSAIAAALAASSAAAIAGGNTAVNAPLSGPYIQGGLGVGFLRTPNDELQNQPFSGTFSSEHKNYNLAGRVAEGYRYMLNTNIGLGAELGYNYNGQSSYEYNTQNAGNFNLKYRDMSVDLLGVLTYYFTPAWSVNAKAGAAYVMQEITGNASYLSTLLNRNIENKSQFLPEIAMGVSYNVSQHVALGVEGSYIFGSKINSVNTEKSNLNASDIDKVPSSGNVMATMTYTF